MNAITKVFKFLYKVIEVLSLIWMGLTVAFIILCVVVFGFMDKEENHLIRMGENYIYDIDNDRLSKEGMKDIEISDGLQLYNFDNDFIIAQEYLGSRKELPVYYLIVDKRKDKLFVELSKDRYDELCDSLGVTISLENTPYYPRHEIK